MRNLTKNHFHDCVLWANALDLALNVKDKFQVSLTLNFPNYSNITDIPEIATWLVSTEARHNFMNGMENEFLKNNSLQNNEKVLTFSEFVTISRVSPAKSLGLDKFKGNLGIGADGDINILDININDIDVSKDHQLLKEALTNLDYVIKAGTIVKTGKNINSDLEGQIIWSNGSVRFEGKDFIMSKKKEFYQKYSSMFYESFTVSIDEKYLRQVK